MVTLWMIQRSRLNPLGLMGRRTGILSNQTPSLMGTSFMNKLHVLFYDSVLHPTVHLFIAHESFPLGRRLSLAPKMVCFNGWTTHVWWVWIHMICHHLSWEGFYQALKYKGNQAMAPSWFLWLKWSGCTPCFIFNLLDEQVGIILEKWMLGGFEGESSSTHRVWCRSIPKGIPPKCSLNMVCTHPPSSIWNKGNHNPYCSTLVWDEWEPDLFLKGRCENKVTCLELQGACQRMKSSFNP